MIIVSEIIIAEQGTDVKIQNKKILLFMLLFTAVVNLPRMTGQSMVLIVLIGTRSRSVKHAAVLTLSLIHI